MSSEAKTCAVCGVQFVHEQADLQMYQGFDVPPAEECPRCRLRHLFAFWNFGAFRKSTSALSGKSLITPLPASLPYPIYTREEWVSDAWDALDYGRDYDPTRPFFEQFKELRDKVPHPHQSGVNNTDSDWCDDIWNCKSCYLCRSLLDSEQVSYGYRTLKGKDSIDIVYTFDLERCYDCTYCFRCYEVRHAFDCRDCLKSSFLYDCRNVQNCFMCWNLRNKQYCIRNRQYSKEEYETYLKTCDLRSYATLERLKEEFAGLVADKAVHRENFNTQVAHVDGNFLTECRNCEDCMFLERSENNRHVWRGNNDRDCIDAVGNFDTERSVESVMNGKIYDSIGIAYSYNCRYSAYLEACEDCEYCFGCVGLRKKKYCVFNKQYDKEEYLALVDKIKGIMRASREWGKFLPIEMADIGYNLTNAHLMFPETRESAESFRAAWHDFSEEIPDGMDANDLPDSIDEVSDSITTQALICPVTKRRYNVAPHELAFYRHYGIPLPRRHFDHRMSESFNRMSLAIEKQKGSCTFCREPLNHYFPKDFGYQRIACIECYQREVA